MALGVTSSHDPIGACVCRAVVIFGPKDLILVQ